MVALLKQKCRQAEFAGDVIEITVSLLHGIANEHERVHCHPQTQGKIERWHLTLKNRVLLENYYLPGDLEAQIARFVEHYNYRRYHESLKNLTPADVYSGRDQTIALHGMASLCHLTAQGGHP